jgi:hypothetical protein
MGLDSLDTNRSGTNRAVFDMLCHLAGSIPNDPQVGLLCVLVEAAEVVIDDKVVLRALGRKEWAVNA